MPDLASLGGSQGSWSPGIQDGLAGLRQAHLERASLPDAALDAHAAAQGAHRVLDNGEPQARSPPAHAWVRSCPRGVDLVKALKNPVQVLRRDADPGVADAQH